MKACREIKQYFQGDLSEPQLTELRNHLAGCPKCAKEYRLVRLERRLLRATLPGEEALELSPGFLAKLRMRRHAAQPGERWTFWDLVWSFSRPVVAVATVLLIFIGGWNLYTSSNKENDLLRMESYLAGPSTDDVGLILAEDVALTHERVLSTLVVIREDDNGNRQ
jgi:hypothetical protein